VHRAHAPAAVQVTRLVYAFRVTSSGQRSDEPLGRVAVFLIISGNRKDL
jgi:hypothetical protein